MLKKALIASVLAMSIAMTGCSDQKAEQKAPKVNPAGEIVKKLDGTSWELVMDGSTKGDCEELPPLMEFLSQNRMAGNLGCNLINGNYKLHHLRSSARLSAMSVFSHPTLSSSRPI